MEAARRYSLAGSERNKRREHGDDDMGMEMPRALVYCWVRAR